MVLDSSVLIAILENEKENASFRALIQDASVRLISSASVVEAGIVAQGRGGQAALDELWIVIQNLRLSIIPFDEAQAREAIEAYRRFGKGRHEASLNFGDCMSYGLSRVTGEPLLFKGNDFIHTDVMQAANSEPR